MDRLHQAARDGNLEIARELLHQGHDVNERDNILEQTPLHDAFRFNRVEMARFLPERGADLEAGDKYGNTPLHNAARFNRVEMVWFLLERGADLEARDKRGNTPLHSAITLNRVEMVWFLLERGADLEARGKHDHTPLHHAVSSNYVGMVGCLLDRGADLEARNTSGATPLNSAALWPDRVGMVRYLLGRGADLEAGDKYGNTPLHNAVTRNRVEMVRYLLGRGADLEARDKNGDTPLRLGCPKFNMFEFLLSRGADATTTNNHGRTVLHFILFFDGGPTWMSLLFDHIDGGPSMLYSKKNSKGYTPLHIARNVASTRCLVEYGFDPSISGFQSTWMCPSILFLRDNRGKTPLEHCEKWKNKGKAKYLGSFESLSLVDPATMKLSAGEAGLNRFQRFLARRVYYTVLCKIPTGHGVALRVVAFLHPADVMK